ncbi:MAG: ankyrin repeat domain-containing protein [Verrucomicrobiota bacterium]
MSRSLWWLGFLWLSACGDVQEGALETLSQTGYRLTADELQRAVLREDPSLLQRFFEAGMAVDAVGSDGETALQHAAKNGREAALQLLLEEGADGERLDAAGRSPLMGAAAIGAVPGVRLLLKEGVEVGLKDAQGWSALTLAAHGGHAETVEVLAPFARDSLDDGLLLAALAGRVETVDVLLSKGANVLARQPGGGQRSALMLASLGGHRATVDLLLLHGANPYALDAELRTAGQLAAGAGQEELAAFLNRPPSAWAEAAATLPLEEGLSPEGDPVVVDEVAGAKRSLRRLDGLELAPESEGPAEGAAPMIEMREYRERPLPVLVAEVREEEADVRLLFEDHRVVRVATGQVLPGTRFRLVATQLRRGASKSGGGQWVDLSTVVVEDTVTGETRRFLKGIEAASGDPYAVVARPGEEGPLLQARVGDVFSENGRRYEVVEIRPTQFIIEAMQSRERLTIRLSDR